MARVLAVLLVFASVLVATVLPARAAAPRVAAVPFRIDQNMIGRAPLGKPPAFYRRAYASQGSRVLADGGFDRLIFEDWHLELLFRPGGQAAVGAITWAARVTTGLGVGACSRTTTLVSAYGQRLERVAQGRSLTAYRLGRLVFVTGLDGFVHSVGLLAAGVSVVPVLNAPACGWPSIG
jgi:hypothetical protein